MVPGISVSESKLGDIMQSSCPFYEIRSVILNSYLSINSLVPFCRGKSQHAMKRRGQELDMLVWQVFYLLISRWPPQNDTKISIFSFFFPWKARTLITSLHEPALLKGATLGQDGYFSHCPDLYWTVVYQRGFVQKFQLH